jgi:hypothetical protein
MRRKSITIALCVLLSFAGIGYFVGYNTSHGPTQQQHQVFGHGGSGNLPPTKEEKHEEEHKEGPQVYVAQAGVGGETGASCATAHSVAWFNEESHWGTGKPIAPGTTVDLCGTITSVLNTQKNGSSGNPIVLYFTSGAKIAMGGSGCPSSGCINVAGNSEYITINGGSDGKIENTNRGTAKEKSEAATTGIQANGCKHCTIENLEIANLYVAEKGDTAGNTEIRGLAIREGTPEYVTITHDTFTNMGWAVNVEMEPTSNHIEVVHNVFTHLTHGFTPTANFNGGNVGPVVFAYNRFYGNLNWEDGETDTNHADAVHCFSQPGKHAHYTGLYIYDNWMTMEGENITSAVFLEGGLESEGGRTPCADKTSNIWVFNNVGNLTSTAKRVGNGILGLYSGEPHVYNNTLIGASSSTEETCYATNSAATEEEFKNNALSTCSTLIAAETARFASEGLNYNLYANGGSRAFQCNSSEYAFAEFSKWQSCTGQDTNAVSSSNAKLNLTETSGIFGKPETGSPALGVGTNLTSLCKETPEEALCKNINGESRPSTGAWNIGAY